MSNQAPAIISATLQEYLSLEEGTRLNTKDYSGLQGQFSSEMKHTTIVIALD